MVLNTVNAALRKTDGGGKSAQGDRYRTIRCCIGFALQLSWLPAAYYALLTPWSGLPLDKVLPLVIFCVFTVLSCACAAWLQRIPMLTQARRLDLIAGGMALAGFACSLLSLTVDTGSVTLPVFALGCYGVACGMAFLLWERTLAGASINTTALAVGCSLGAVLVACIFMVPGLTMPTGMIAAVGTVVSLAIKPKTDVPTIDENVSESRLSKMQIHRFLIRYLLSTFLLGFCTVTMMELFASETYASFDARPSEGAVLGIVCFAILLLVSWLPKRELSPFMALRLAFAVDIMAFFPINPGTPSNLQLVFTTSIAWCVAIFGVLGILSVRIDRAFARMGSQSFGVSVVGVFAGMLAGTVTLLVVNGATTILGLIAQGLPQGVQAICTISAVMMLIVFCATNLLIGDESLRKVELTARRKFATSVTIAQNARTAATADDMPPRTTTVDRCRQLALDFGLTPREFEVLTVLAHGNTLAKVESELVISEGTAVTHRRNIYRKLGVHSKQELLDLVSKTPVR